MASAAEDEEEEKVLDDSEEEDKRMEDEDDDDEDDDSLEDSDGFSQRPRASSLLMGGDQPEDHRVDQVFFFISQALLFGRISAWEKTKLNLITCAISVVAATRSSLALNQPVPARLRMMEHVDDIEPLSRSRARSLSNASALADLPEVLGRLRPFFIMVCVVDLIKTTWDGRVAD